MNHTTNDRGEYVIAIGAPGSIARVTVEYPMLIAELNDLYENAGDCYGRMVDEAVKLIRASGIKSKLETQSVLAASYYGQEPEGSVTSLLLGGYYDNYSM